MKTTGTASLS